MDGSGLSSQRESLHASLGIPKLHVVIRNTRGFEFSNYDNSKMRWSISLLLLGLLGLVQALSSSGSRLLVVLEDLADKSKYSKFLGDLEGMCRQFGSATL